MRQINRIRRIGLASALLAALVAVPLWSVEFEGAEFGGTLESDTAVSDAPAQDDVEHSDKLFLFLRGGDPERLDVLIRGSYEFNLDEAYQFNLTALRAAGTIPLGEPVYGALSYRAGRFSLSDASQILLSQRIDGVAGTLDLTNVEFRLGAGYTGLLFPDPAGLYITAADLQEYEEDDDLFAPGKAIGLAAVGFPEVVGRQTVRVLGVAQFDTRSDLEAGEDSLSTYYPAIVVEGPITRSLFYTLGAAGGFGTLERKSGSATESTTLLSAMGTLSLQYLPWKLDWFNAELGVVGATGDDDVSSYVARDSGDKLNQFVPLRSFGVGEVLSPDLSNLIAPRLLLEAKPFANSSSRMARNLGLSLAGYGYFRPSSGATSVSPATPGSDTAFIGSEADLKVSFRPTSDVGLSVYGGLFMPNTASESPLGSDADRAWEAGAELSVSF